MDNYQAIDYACVALKQLKKENKEITEISLRGRMLYLMDMYSEIEIEKLNSND
jgi:hypothetical protein